MSDVFAISQGTETLLIYVAAAVIGAAILGFGRAVMKFVQTRQTRGRQDAMDDLRLSEFLFGTERDPSTGVPAREGWTVKVDKALAQLATSQEHTNTAVNKILYELSENGGHNFRGVVERGIKTAESEAGKNTTERERVQRRDHTWDDKQ